MTSWMDLDAIPVPLNNRDDEPGLAASCKIIHGLLDEEIAAGTDSKDIILGGFSQGGAMALLAAYSYSKPLAGVAVMSGWPALQGDWQARVDGGANAKTPAFIGHGSADPVVLPECGAEAARLLKASGVETTYNTYPVEHGAHPQELEHLRLWMKGVFGDQLQG